MMTEFWKLCVKAALVDLEAAMALRNDGGDVRESATAHIRDAQSNLGYALIALADGEE